jgi:PAS domain S-box-containing protein
VTQEDRGAAGALAEVARAIALSREPQAILDLIVDRARTALAAQRSFVIQVLADERVRITASRGLISRSRELLPRHGREGVAMTAIAERRPVWSRDVLNDPAIELAPLSRAFIEGEGYRAPLGVPLLAGTRVLGVLMTCRDAVGDFSPADIELAQAFGDLAAIALERARLSALEADRLRLDQALVELERDLLAELDPARLVPLIGERACRLVGGSGTVWLSERGGGGLRRGWTNWPAHPLENRPFGDGIAGLCARTRRGTLVADYPSWPDANRVLVDLGVTTAVGQPLLSRGELLGVITLSRMGATAARFEPTDLSLLERFAAQAALALRNATLYGEAEQRRRAAEELAHLARTLSEREDPVAVGQEIARSVLAVFDVSSCNVRLLRPDGGLEAIAASFYEVGHVQRPGIGLSARALAEGRAVWTADLLNDPGVAWDEDFRRRSEAAGRRAALMVPMRTERGIVGVLQLSSSAVREFSDQEVEIAQSFADQAALALESVRLHGNLRASEERTRLIVDTALDAVITIDEDGRVTGWNAQAERTFGWSREEVLGRVLAETIIPPRYRAAHAEGLRRYRASGQGPVVNRRLELSALHRDGREFPVELSISPVSLAGGTTFSAFVRDITERKQAEAAIQQHTAMVKLLQMVAVAANEAPTPRDALQIGVDQVCAYTGWPVGDAFVLAQDGSGDLSPALVWHVDQPERFRHFQSITDRARFQRGVGLPGRVLATASAAWIVDVTRDANFPRVKAAVDSGVKAAFAFPVLAGSEVVAVLEFFSGEHREPDPALLDAMAHIGTTLGRVFERHRAAEELRLAKEAAESASGAKSSFLATMSHELRTPLNAVLGYAQVLGRDPDLRPEQRKALGIIEGSGEHLLSLINEILDLAKIEAGTIEIRPAPFDLPRLLQGLAELMRARAKEKGLTFTGEWPPDLPAAVHADEKRLRQVLMNLLDNAIKYTTEGGVALKMGPHQGRLRFMVEDTGVGIRPEQLPKIFESFHQVRDPSTFAEGTGLGLAISRTLVGLMGGTLEVASTPGEGSRFWFDLLLPAVPLVRESPDRQRPSIIGVRGARRRLLVVDDKEDNRALVRDLLAPLGFEILEAEDARACLRLAASERPDAILLDLRMPGMDGLEATRRLRAMPDTRDLVIIAVSASAFEQHREDCLAAGANDFLAKPFRLDRLLDLLHTHLGIEMIYADAPAAGPSPTAGDGRGMERIVPTAAELDGLLDLARRGHIKQILAEAQRLEVLDARYAPFLAEVRALTEQFQVKKLCQLLEQARSET